MLNVKNEVVHRNGLYAKLRPTGQVASALTIGSTGWDGSGIIEVSGSDENGQANNKLLINYFCGRNTLINTNTSLSNGGGIVSMGKFVKMMKHLEIGDPQWGNGNDPNNTAIDINLDAGKGIRFTTNNNSIDLISINNTNPSTFPFVLKATGKVGIGTASPIEQLEVWNGNILIKGNNNFTNSNDNAILYLGNSSNFIKGTNGLGITIGTNSAPNAFVIKENSEVVINSTDDAVRAFSIIDNSSGALNFLVYGDGRIYSRELTIQVGTFPDYVFDKDYNLMSLDELKKFILAHHHLPGIQSQAEFKKSEGLNVGRMQMQLLQKSEELILYVLQLKEQNDLLKAEMEQLKTLIINNKQ